MSTLKLCATVQSYNLITPPFTPLREKKNALRAAPRSSGAEIAVSPPTPGRKTAVSTAKKRPPTQHQSETYPNAVCWAEFHEREDLRTARVTRAQSMQRCSVGGTVVATVASQANTGALTALSSSVAQAGFPCTVVQPTGPVRPPPTFGTEGRGGVRERLFLLSTLALEPWNTQCGSAEQNARRDAELHRARLWRTVLDQHLNLLAIDVAHSLASNPLPHIRSLDTSERRHGTGRFFRFGATLPDIVGTADGWELRHDLLWVRSTAATRALAVRAENRTWGSSLHSVWNEELSYNQKFGNVSCCHTPCVRRYITNNSGVGVGTSEAGCLGGAAMTRTRAIHASAPPQGTQIEWRHPGWQAGRYNEHMPFTREWARCTDPANYCFRRAIEHAPTNSTANLPAVGSRLEHRYDADRMLGADTTFHSPCFRFLRGIEPSILRLEGSSHPTGANVLGPDLGVSPQGVIKSIRNPNGGAFPVRFFNPSIVRAPPGLCPRCAYVVSLRADCTHQCDSGSLYSVRSRGERSPAGKTRLFRGTAIVVLDSALRRLGWTWLINAPRNQVEPRGKYSAHLRSNKTLRLAQPGDSNGFPPVYTSPVFDVRLLYYRGNLFATAVVPVGKSEPFCLVHLQVTATPTDDGGLTHLRVWSSQRISATTPWALGRNQALFSSADGRELLIQPW